MLRVQITGPAMSDIEQAFDWWSTNRSAEEAVVWYEEITKAIATLERMPQRCPLVPETALSITGVRQLLFGVGPHPTHRIIFGIQQDLVSVLRVRHHAQDDLGPGELAPNQPE